MSVLSIGAARAAVITVAAASALALLALPSAAHAAEVVTCTQQVTAESQPWLTFSESENFYSPFADVVSAYLDTSLELTDEFPVAFTADDLDEYEQALIAAEETFQAGIEGLEIEDGSLALNDQLGAIDPDNTTGWKEKLAELTAQFGEEADLPGFTQNFTAFLSASQAFSASASAAVDADVPAGGPFVSPAVPTSLETDRDAAVAALVQIGETYQTVVLDGAVAYVVYEEVCVTTTVADAAAVVAPKALAATGTSDGIALGTAAGLLLLVGAAVTAITVRRRHSA